MMNSKQTFTFSIPALRVLENEHQLLTYLMNKWHPLVLAIEREQFTNEVEARNLFKTLRTEIKNFIEPLKNHTDKEEAYLFPALAKYVGDEQGPVQAIQAEHEEIDTYIGDFLHQSSHIREEQLTVGAMKEIAHNAQEAFEVITFHFIKEETIIFPMVESILKPKQHYELLENLYSSII